MLAGMAIGGWMSGAIFDAMLSYRVAFLTACLEFGEHGDRGLAAAAATPAQDGKIRVKPIHCRADLVVSPTIGLRVQEKHTSGAVGRHQDSCSRFCRRR